MPLEPETIKAIDELYSSYKCSVCGFQAQRYSVGRYYCLDCLIKKRQAKGNVRVNVKEAKHPKTENGRM